jgi:hypothetical protein
MRAAAEWIERYRSFWTTQLDGLAHFLENKGDGESSPRRGRKKEKPS